MINEHLQLPQGYAALPTSSHGHKMMFRDVIRAKGRGLWGVMEVVKGEMGLIWTKMAPR